MARAARRAWKTMLILSFIGFQVLTHFVLRDSLGAAAIAGIAHAMAFLTLLWYFGRTLLDGREPLITRLARSVHGSLPPEITAFTRRVTAAWCAFFAFQVLLSALLLTFAPFEIWSLFVNVLELPLLVLMFVGDHLYRAIRFPDYPHASIARILRAFVEVASTPEGTKAH